MIKIDFISSFLYKLTDRMNNISDAGNYISVMEKLHTKNGQEGNFYEHKNEKIQKHNTVNVYGGGAVFESFWLFFWRYG